MTIHSLNFVIIITYIKLAKLKIAPVGGGSPKKESSNGLNSRSN